MPEFWSRRTFLRCGAITATVGVSGCLDVFDEDSAPALLTEGPVVDVDPIASGLTYPTDLAEPDDGTGRLFVTDQPGVVRVIDDGELLDDPAIDLTEQMVTVGPESLGGFDERGLLGIAFHPEVSSNDRLFLRYSAPAESGVDHPAAGHAEVLSEFLLDGDTIATESERELLRISQPSHVHNSGDVLFGPDGYLYMTTGDGGGTFDNQPDAWFDTAGGGTGQNTRANRLGGVLRIDVDVGTRGEYGIPADNPLVDVSGHYDEYFAWGVRNPWGTSFDGEDLYLADVGEALYESVNLIERGGNYGWNVREGTHCHDPQDVGNPPESCPEETPSDVRGGEPLLDPIIEYPQEYDGSQIGSAIVGGHVLRSGEPEVLQGTYVFGDWSADAHVEPRGQLFVAQPQDEAETVSAYASDRNVWPMQRLQIGEEGGELERFIAGMGQDLAGNIYVLTSHRAAIRGDTGEVLRLRA